ncbi:hypothetical protein [Brevibacterium atlanticum]|uniref:hypothetical protein n=1 Tax=Brevibacterium atlanticum TaxID=2697563 RepID=UPI00141DA246|nr:hypothetical protein [Brevibacterium atlanticum]
MTHSSPPSPSGPSAPLPEPTVQEQSRFVRDLRRTIAIVIVVAFSVAAIGGIIVMLGDIDSEATFQVIGTTSATGACSVAAFCGAALIGRRAQWFGSVTILLALVTLVVSLLFIWGDPYGWDDPIGSTGMTIVDVLYQTLLSIVLVTAVASVASLILLLVPRSWVVRIGLPITLCFLALGTCLVLVTIWMEGAWQHDWLTRLNGIVWILAALGVVVVPLTSLLLKAGSKPEAASAAAAASADTAAAPAETDEAPAADSKGPVADTSPDSEEPATSASPASTRPVGPTLSPSTVDRLEAAARAEGITADELVDRLLVGDSQGGADIPTAPDDSSIRTSE